MQDTEINLTEKQAHTLATYIAAYIQEELERGIPANDIGARLIHDALEAYQGGAR